VDDVLLVVSSRSFGAVNREQFYVSISRGRERVHVFTDDAELLARRITDSRERKAAVELQALRDELTKLGFVRKEPENEKISSPLPEDFRAMRPLDLRPRRIIRLSPTQRLGNFVEDVRRQVEEWLGNEQKETVAEKVEPTESVKQAETVKQTETVREPRTVKDAIEQRNAARHKLRRGLSPRRDTGHSRGMGV
jgi:ATP-dependent exoDNAse (exonuclease V) alpha subunit